MIGRRVRILVIICVVFSGIGLQGSVHADPSQSSKTDDFDRWLEDDWEQRIRQVNEGQLEFLTTPPDGRVLRTANYLTITPDSLKTGWVELNQCQSNLDPLHSVEVVYRFHGLKDLRIRSSRGIEKASVEGHRVQLENVAEGGEVCIDAKVRVLNPVGNGTFELRSGPFHRRFLDGYYPVHLDYRLSYPPKVLALKSVDPESQNGFVVQNGDGQLDIDAWFEGKLTIALRFQHVNRRSLD